MAAIAAWRRRLTGLNQMLLYAVMFLLPGQVAPVFTLCALMLLIWTCEPELKLRVSSLPDNPIFWSFHAYFWVFVLALGWTQNLDAGISMVDRTLALLLITPVMLTVITPERINGYFLAFLLGTGASAVLAHYNLLQLYYFPQWPLGMVVDKSPGDTAPIIDRVNYAPLLAWAAYLSARQAILSAGKSRLFYAMLFVLIANNLMFSGGRTGLIAMLALIFWLAIDKLPMRRLTATISAGLIVAAIVLAGYVGSEHLRERIHIAAAELANIEPKVGNSVGLRIGYAITASHTWWQSPWFGVGAGDFEQAYRTTNEQRSPDWPVPRNPHNQYLFVAVTTGVIGLFILLLVYYPPALRHLPYLDGRDDLRIALPIWITAISLFDSYLWRPNTCLIFVLFSALIWAQTSRRPRKF